MRRNTAHVTTAQRCARVVVVLRHVVVDQLGMQPAQALLALRARLAIQERLSDKNSEDILRGADVVVDATDNFDTRYVINRACVALKVKKPYICLIIIIYIY